MSDTTFLFEAYAFDAASGTLTLDYAYADGPRFRETIVFAPPFRTPDRVVLDRIFRLVFLLAGVSYYKARVPARLECRAFEVDAGLAAFIEKVYLHGLGEFAHRNGLDLRGNIHLAHSDVAVPAPLALPHTGRVLVPVGGGKDSIVSLETLRRGGADVTLFALGGTGGAATPIADTIRVSGLPSVYVSRALAPELIALNKTGVYNGHVPITAILSAIALAACVLYGFDAVVMSNEHSASAPNFVNDGFAVNHQYSKSLDFERDLAAYVATRISPDLGYFSLLRPCSELDITRRFARYDAYFGVFRSCNTAFRQDAGARGTHWCRNCPKCRFVFLALAPFVEKSRLVGIFGGNMLDDVAQTDGFAALCGLDGYKPFECVGEVEESAAAMAHIGRMPVWRDDAVVRALASRARGDIASFFTLHDDHAVPPDYLRMLRDAG